VIALFGNLDFGELLVIALVAVMVFGRNLPRVAAQAVTNVAKARRALQRVWRESGIGDEIRDVQRELDSSSRRLRDVDARSTFRSPSQEITETARRKAVTNADEETGDPDAGRGEEDAGEAEPGEPEGVLDAAPDEPEGEQARRPDWYPEALHPPSASGADAVEEPAPRDGDGPLPPGPDPAT